ncbi:DEAD/DEAH box helicase [Gluconacetobacter entanii]|uniref:DEAD/DEAH box helicase n=1 Tax=Gluconacetobacter entanii TaxID=108528 RepID=A0A318Q0S3_9PROT|nr:DEAD/DEAH box helicase [Gluconacetobacter entanii]MBE7620400.1 DEAD/DEAH box helicase [Komagataeibacter sp. FXV2]MCE2578996.1 DEAD/DEAH box helicase [Komagataeibacter sp. FNDCR1]MBY4640780.1 DEAD/DEAH box helicase [Gluconacetobacter entanii]MCW4581194.1 DEAD/DEAH box helicase [Gluconacetobacter entanii]MCW4584454.1 DEAD/DEAH box helicase [Gluconacetobacter entanii]
MSFPETHPALQRALDERGYENPTPVQTAVLDVAADGRDLLVSAQTGSGKTVAFGLAMADTLLGGDERLGPAGPPLAVIIAPTRELAMQVTRELTWLYAPAGARIVSCIGGMDARREARALQMGAHIVVGTPGRLCDHLSRGRLVMTDLRVVVLDEADEMLDLGFRDELEQLLDAMPKTRRTLLFSATIAREIASLAKRYQHDALRIDTLSGSKQHADIEYRALLTDAREIIPSVVNVLRETDSPTTMVFCATRELVRHMQSALVERGFSSVALSGELGQAERTRAIDSLRKGQASVCVATDVAARGIDIPALALVVHASLPTDPATLLHRSGRTGRAGRKGVCVLMVPVSQRRRAERLMMGAKISATWSAVPSAEEIRVLDTQRLLADPALSEEVPEADRELISRLTEAHSPEQLAAALLRTYRAHLPQPENVRQITPDSRPPRAEGPRAPRESRDYAPREPGEWFSMSVGRQDKADPKWLVPLICRLGGVRKSDIGAIRIADTQTLFEIAPDTAEKFRSCIAAIDNDEVQVAPASAPAGGAGPRRAPGPRGPRPPAGGRRPRPFGGGGGHGGPRGGAHGSSRKRSARPA